MCETINHSVCLRVCTVIVQDGKGLCVVSCCHSLPITFMVAKGGMEEYGVCYISNGHLCTVVIYPLNIPTFMVAKGGIEE